MQLTLRRILMSGMVLMTVVPLVAVVGWYDSRSRASIGGLADDVMAGVADRVKSQGEQHLQRANDVLDGIGSNSAFALKADLGRNLIEKPEEFERLAFALTRQVDTMPYIYLGTNSGRFQGIERVIGGVRIGIKPPLTESGRSYYLAQSPGDRSKPQPAETKNYDPRTRPWYIKAANERDRAWSDVYPSASKKTLLVTLGQPIYDAQQVLLGVFALDVPLNVIAEQLRRQKISARGVAFIVDESGLLVASSTGDDTYKEGAKGLERVSVAESASVTVRRAGAHVQRERETRDASVLSLDDQVRRVQFADSTEPMLVVQRRFGSDLGLKWTLVVASPELDFTHEADERRRYALWVVGALALLCGGIALLFATQLSRQLRCLSLAALALGRGEVPPAPAPSRLTEVDQLGTVIHKSAMDLSHYRLQVERDELALREAHDMLERRVMERTAELAASREEALEAARAKAAFLATMSHEIRTPLNGVVGMSSLLAETSLDVEQRDYLSTIRVSSDQLLGVINDILDFSKIESGKLELEQEPLLLRHVVEEACDIAALRAREKGLELIIDVPAASQSTGSSDPMSDSSFGGSVPQAVMGDPTRIRQVLINFINNAVKFTEKGEVSVQVRQVSSQFINGQEHVILVFRVRDSGIGIPADRVGKLFAAFTQVDASTTRKYGGTGLGLAICKRLAEAMGGEVGVSSTEGKGSEFWFSMLARVCDATSAAHLVQLPADAIVLQDKTVWIVDDNATNLRILQRQLRAWNLAVQSFDSGAALLAGLKLGPLPHAIVSDLHMPEQDGIDLAKAIKAQDAYQAIALLLLSSSTLPSGSDDTTAAMFSARLLKPARESQLFDALVRAMSPNSALVSSKPVVRVKSEHTVLVADDNAVNLKVAVSMLSKLGYESVTAEDGRLAVDAVLAAQAANRPFALVLMDVNMPNMDGLDATRSIKAKLGAACPPVVALTAAASVEDRERCLAAGMDDYLTKPLQLNALARGLQRWVLELQAERLAQQAAADRVVIATKNEATDAENTKTNRQFAAKDSTATPGAQVQSTHHSLALLNPERLAEFREFDDDEQSITRSVVEVFLTDLPPRLQALQAALDIGDVNELSQVAHAIKGAASNVGADRLRELASVLEADAKAGQLPADPLACLQTVQRTWDQTQAAVDAYLKAV